MQKFFTPIQLCYTASCTSELAQWTQEFEELADDVPAAVLNSVRGAFQPGMYLRKHGYWKLALNYADLCRLLNNGVQFKVIAENTTQQTFSGNPTIYRNGYQVPGVVVDPGPNQIWVVATPLSGGGGTAPGALITLTDLFGTPIVDFFVA